MLRSELVKFAEDKLASVEKQTENGQILDYAQKAGVVEVEPIDLNNIDAWVAGRNKSLTMASAFMAQGSLQQDDATVFDLGKVKAFTKAERAFIQSWASTASPQDVADFVPQDQEGLDELLFEFDVVGAAEPSHGCDHVFGDSEFGS